jgi:ribonuclease E
MTKRILIDATHAEETRVVLLDGSKVEDFDVETANKRQLKGNIYLAKVVRVEPSLQAAFVEYGGGRHGFLAFGEIHPDYYQIPIADREKLLALQAEAARAEERADERAEDEDAEPLAMARPETRLADAEAVEASETEVASPADSHEPESHAAANAPDADQPMVPGDAGAPAHEAADDANGSDNGAADAAAAEENAAYETPAYQNGGYANGAHENGIGGETGAEDDDESEPEAAAPETVGGAGDTFEGNGADEARVRARRAASFLRNYRIQEVIKRRQILLVQVVKEERGNKGAALTTYISLAGRFCVLMPNSPRGGGISRKITSAADRRRLKEITTELQIPDGMGLIVRTAGAARPKPEIMRDCEYLMRLWDDIRELTLSSVAPALIYEEANLIKRTIRDLYTRDIEDVAVDGESGWKAAHEFMRMLMPSHAKKVVLWQGATPLFAHHHVEAQLDAMLLPNVPLRSGGSLVINQAEALVAIDVNSGRGTRERGIEETALKTNLEAADEVARQLRLRDLAGLIVIDFIDMENRRNNAAVERRLKEALKNDRARIQVGSISHFGLLEMSRQRLRPSLAESSFVPCPHCGGTGHVRGTENSAIHVLRAIEEEAAKGRASAITVHMAADIALYLLNHKRARIAEIEQRTGLTVTFAADATLIPPAIRIERVRARAEGPHVPVAAQTRETTPRETTPREAVPREVMPRDMAHEATARDMSDDDDDTAEGEDNAATTTATEAAEGERRRRRRRRRRGGRREEGDVADAAAPSTASRATITGETGDEPAASGEDDAGDQADPALSEQPEITAAGGDAPRARRRGRRGGRRRRRDGQPGGMPLAADAGTETDDEAEEDVESAPVHVAPPAYVGPTPADPFAGQALDIFDLMERAEQAQLAPPAPLPTRARAGEVMVEQMALEPASQAMPAGEVEAGAPAEPQGIEVPRPEPETMAAMEESPAPSLLPPPVDVEPAPVAPEARKRGWWRK